jgi:hypothetical protein
MHCAVFDDTVTAVHPLMGVLLDANATVPVGM